MFVAARASWVTGFGSGAVEIGTIENISDELFDTWLLPFEATVLLLTIAAVGTIALAQYERKTRDGLAPGTGYQVPADEASAEEAS